ncbi:coiled-coil domain-containing protein 42 homolog [Calliopsis andreniformis]|uniref:coiled-coil domain-containing protein 42 homolog n=1 Tax=Calliopsis andreniformis TaxID=337506 RepID=UPI003FCDF6B0
MTTIEEGTKNFIRRAVVPTDPQKAVTEYFLSKQEDRKIKKHPEWDKPRVFPASELVRAHFDLAHVEEKLHAKWDEQKRKRRLMDEQWKKMRRQELILRESFIGFNRFVKDNQEKRERAEVRIKEELERQAKRQAEINEFNKKLTFLTNVRESMKKHVGEYKKYQNYLERVVAETGEFQSIAEVFNRYETLMEARKILAVHQDQHLQMLEETGTEIYHMTEAKSQKFLGLNNKLAQLQARREKAQAQALRWETIVSRIKVTVAEKALEHTQVKICCWNLYQQICRRKHMPISLAKDDFEQQLEQIKRTILELKRIIKVARKRAGRG